MCKHNLHCVFALVLPVCLCSIYLSMVFHVLSRQHGHCRLPQAPGEEATAVGERAANKELATTQYDPRGDVDGDK